MEMSAIAEKMQQRLSGSQINGSVKLDCGDDGALLMEGQSVSLADGPADCVISLSKTDLEALVAGDLDPMGAFMQGKLKVDGDMSVAMQLSQLL